MADNAGKSLASTLGVLFGGHTFWDVMGMENQQEERQNLEVKFWVRKRLGFSSSGCPELVKNPSFSHSVICVAAPSYTV